LSVKRVLEQISNDGYFQTMGSTTKKGNTANPGLSRAAEVPPPSFVVITGPFELTIHGTTSGNIYLGWTPTQCTLRITNAPQSNLNVILKNRDISSGGQVDFRTTYTSADQATLPLTVPGDGSAVTFFVGGKFGSPSFHDQDGAISIHDAATDAVLHQRTIMVRVRKDANVLTNAERDRFLTAFASLNSNAAVYQAFVDNHNSAADPEIHGRPSFLVWHRAFVLHLERLLQAIDPSVAIPYWRFERTAPNVFIAEFMGGAPNSAGRVNLSAANPLRNWTISGVTGIVRVPGFNTTSGAPSLLNETATLQLGTVYSDFRTMENDPHGSAHVSFNTGPITSIGNATKDPLFFLLHCNVDRLWALWQLAKNRWDTPNTDTYSGAAQPGDGLTDTMWPWNGVTGGTRPSTAPGGPMPQPGFPSKPSPQPIVQEMIDYIGRTQGNTNNFDYDDVPFV
jgi:tyrosinase